MKVLTSLLCNLAIAARHLAVVGWPVKSKQPVRSSKVTTSWKKSIAAEVSFKLRRGFSS